jgi:pyruvate dehydrogenase E2 component (dihydrolipoamide acetyltransferase)
MSTDVIMPQMGESIFEGTITKWLKKAGDSVEKDEPLFEISTDKVDAEIPSPISGVLTEIKIAEGATVEVNTVVAVIDGVSAPAAAPAPVQKASAPQTIVPPVPVQPPARKANESPADVQVEVVMPQLGESIFEGTITKWLKQVGDAVQADQPLFEISTDKVDAEIPAPISGVLTAILAGEGETVQVNTVVAKIGSGAATPVTPPARSSAAQSSVPASAVPGSPVQRAAPPQVVPGRRIRSSPLARRIAKEHGIDLSRVAGTGSAGRVSKDDVLRAVSEPSAAGSSANRAVQESASPQLIPLTRMRAIIAERMVESKRVSPHVHTVYKVDMTRVVQHRAANMAAFEQRNGAKLTYMPYIAVAVIAALKRYPIVNASLASGAAGLGIRYHQNINLGIAVALDWGLIVPVVRQAEQRSFAEIARAVGDLAGRARTKKLTPDEVGGSTFTLTNSGIFGDEFSTPIINQPESAILCISGLKKEPAVVTDAQGNDTIAIRSMQHFTLGFDHRLIDGADACRFMLELKHGLEDWDQEIG